MEVISLICDERFSVTGNSQGNLFLFLLELLGEDYICKKAVYIGKSEKIAIHSMINWQNAVYLVDSYNNKIYKYDYELNEISETNVGRDPRHITLDENNMYVANFESDNISVIDLSNFILTESIPAGIKPHDVLYNSKNRKLYTCCYEENEIIEYSENREQKRHFKTNGKPMHMFVSEDCLIVMTYFVNGNVHTNINFINIMTGEIEKVIIIDGLGSDFDFDERTNKIYLLNIVDKNLYTIDVIKKELTKTSYIGGYPESLTVGKSYVYVNNSKKNQITVIEKISHTIAKVIDLSFTPGCIKVINSDL